MAVFALVLFDHFKLEYVPEISEIRVRFGYAPPCFICGISLHIVIGVEIGILGFKLYLLIVALLLDLIICSREFSNKIKCLNSKYMQCYKISPLFSIVTIMSIRRTFTNKKNHPKGETMI